MSSLHAIKRETVAATELVSNLITIAGDDDTLISDMVEGETSLIEALDLALSQISLDQGLLVGIKSHTDKVATRKARIEKRIGILKSAIQSALNAAHIKTHEGPTATVTTKAIPKSAIVVDESAIPSKYFKPQPPKLDKKALLADLKDGSVDGAELSNGGETIQIRIG